MDVPMWMKITSALFMGYMIFRMVPAARHWLKNGPRGTSKEWLTTSMLLASVVLFVVFLIYVVRST